MHKTVLFIILLISFQIQAQVNQFQKSHKVETDQEVYNDGLFKPLRALIIPFDTKMYISSVDRSIAKKTGLTYQQIRENMRYGIVNQLLLSIKDGHSAISIIHNDTSDVYSDLKYIYNSIGYKYKLVPVKEEAQDESTGNKKLEKIKSSIHNIVKKENKQSITPKEEYDRGGIKNGQIHTSRDNADRYMNTSIHNPNLLNILSQKYNTDVYIFINELDIEEIRSEYPSHNSTTDSYRKVKVHYTIIDQNGVELNGGAATTKIPSNVNDMNRIINTYFAKISEEICNTLPSPIINKDDADKEKEEAKKAKEQRSEIEKY